MYNLPVKLSAMATPYAPLSPQGLLACSPEESIDYFLSILPESARQTLMFAFSPKAILLMLEKEFEVHVAHLQLVFTKPVLDSESWLLANGLEMLPEVLGDQTILTTLTENLWQSILHVLPEGTTMEKRLTLKAELQTLFVLYFYKHGNGNPKCLHSLQSFYGIRQFLNLVVAEALFKADGAKVLFGMQSPYYQLWLKKQHEYWVYAQYLDHLYFQKSA